MPECNADATWHGSVLDGEGSLTLGSGVWSGQYATPETDGASNPEELLAAAHASCYAMTTSYLLNQSGYDPEQVSAEATVTLEQGDGEFSIPSIDLTIVGTVPGASGAEFTAIAREAERACPVSTALAGPDIQVSASLTDS